MGDGWIGNKLDEILAKQNALSDRLELLIDKVSMLQVSNADLVAYVDKEAVLARKALEQILQYLKPPPAPGPVASFVITFTKENNMAKAQAAKAGIDFSVQDNGTVNATLSNIVDAAGNPTTFQAPPVWTSSDPTTISFVAAADGLSAVGTPLKLGTDITVTVVGDGVSETSQGIDVVAGPVSGFAISL